MKVICNVPSKLTQSGITVINPDYKLQWHVSTTNVHLHANEIRFNALLNLKERRKKSVFLKSNLIAYPFKTPYFYLNTIETRFMASILVLCVLRKKNICIQYFFNIMKCRVKIGVFDTLHLLTNTFEAPSIILSLPFNTKEWKFTFQNTNERYFAMQGIFFRKIQLPRKRLGLIFFLFSFVL